MKIDTLISQTDAASARQPGTAVFSQRPPAPARLARAHSIDDLRVLARAQLPRMLFDYIDGAAQTESTAARNRAALDAVRLLGSAPADVGKRSTQIDLFGKRLAAPLIIGPTGYNAAFWPAGDILLARAAERRGVPFVMSNGANVTMEELGARVGGFRWMQLYLPVDRERWPPMVEAARVNGFDAIEITVDTAIPGRRGRDLRNDFGMPLRWTAAKLLDFSRHPAWAFRMFRGGMPKPAIMASAFKDGETYLTPSDLMKRQVNPTVTWDDIKRIRDLWDKPLIVKGLTDPRQGARAVDIGLDGIVISNHGGRQLDGAAATMDVLPEFVSEVGGKMALLIDSGFRSGTDILKALALGATAVQIGRATLYGLAAAGEAGVDRALDILVEELDIAMALCGISALSDATAMLTHRRGASRNCTGTPVTPLCPVGLNRN
jgi:(S)-mandelate dehydrogenase